MIKHMTQLAPLLAMAMLAATLVGGCDTGPQNPSDDSMGRIGRGLGMDQLERTEDVRPDRRDRTGTAEDVWTIVLFWDDSPDHRALVRQVRMDTEEHTGWPDLRVVHEENRSVLYRGTFSTLEQANRQLQQARAVQNAGGVQVFGRAMVVRLPGRDLGPEEWQLRNAPGMYSVLVATFYNVPEQGFRQRREAAVTYCEQLRRQGEQAYLHHDVSISSVTIGSFAPQSVRPVMRDGVRDMEIVDPRMQDVLRRYPKLAVNGMELKETRVVRNPRTGAQELQQVAAESYPIIIPRHEDQGDVRRATPAPAGDR